MTLQRRNWLIRNLGERRLVVYLHIMTGNALDLGQLADVSAVCAALHTRMTARAVTRVYDAALRPLGLESTQFTLLAAIAATPSGSVTALADRLAIERSSLSRNLALLRRLDLIAPVEAPGRSVSYRVTDEGCRRIADALPLWRQTQERLAAAMGGEARWLALRDDMRALRRAARS